MKNFIFSALLVIPAVSFSQSRQLKITKKEKTSFIREGDKIIMAVKTPRYGQQQKPPSVYALSRLELMDSVYVFTKARIISINDSTMILQERNSFLSSTRREIRISKINTIRKLTTGRQAFRTVTTAGGGLALFVMVFYSYVAVGGGEGFVSGMFEAAGIGFFLTRFGRTRVSKKQLGNCKIEVAPLP